MRTSLFFRVDIERDPLGDDSWCIDGRPGPDFPHGITLLSCGMLTPERARMVALEKAIVLAPVWIRKTNFILSENQKISR